MEGEENSPISSSYVTSQQQRNDQVLEEDEEAQHMIVLPNITSKRQIKTARGSNMRTAMGCGIVFVLAIALAVLIVRLEWEPPATTSSNNEAVEETLPIDQEAIVAESKEDTVISCTPKFCLAPKQFIKAEEFIILNSYPGSGSTWVRQLIENGTRIHTGTMHGELALYRAGFQGEMLDPFASDTSPVSAIKSHYPYVELKNGKTSAVILLLRSPFHSVWTDFIRVQAKKHHNRPPPTEEYFPEWFEDGVQEWKRFAEFWLEDWKDRAVITFNNQVLSLTFTRVLVDRPIPVLVVFYEDFELDLGETLKRMFAFLKERNIMQLSLDESVECALRFASQDDRKQEDMHYAIVDQDTRNLACEEWEPYWFKEIWGPCHDASAASATTPKRAHNLNFTC